MAGEDTPTRAGNVFIDFLRDFFKNHEKYPWSENATKTKIVIQECMPVDISRIKNYPAILVEVGPIGLKGASIDQLLTWAWISKKWTEVLVKQHLDLLSGDLAFHVISREGLEVRKIAFALFTILTTNRPLLRAKRIFDITYPRMIADTSVGEDLFIASVAISYLTQVGWRWVPKQGPIVKRFIPKQKVY